MKYKISDSQPTMSFVCRSKCIVCSVIAADADTPLLIRPPAYKNDTFTMFLLLKLLILLTISFLPNNNFKLCSIFQLFPLMAAWQRAPYVCLV